MPSRCPKTSKVRYPTEDEANERLTIIKRNIKKNGYTRGGSKVPKRSYYCEFCRGFHFTSGELYENPLFVKPIILAEQFKKYIILDLD